MSQILFRIMSLLLSLRTENYAAYRIVYGGALLMCSLTYLSRRYLVRRFSRLVLPTMHLLQLSFLVAGIGIAVCQPDVRTATMIAAVLVIPSFFIDVTFIAVL